MTDMSKRGPDCDDDCESGGRGKRGKRGHRGHDGHDGHDGSAGPTGPTGPSAPTGASGGLLKFSGSPAFTVGAIIESFLADPGVGLGILPLIAAPGYPVAIARSLRNMAVNFTSTGLQPSPLATVTVELLRLGVPVPGFVITYAPGTGGIQSVVAGPEPFAIEDTFDVRVTTSGFAGGSVINVSATIGVE